MLKYVFCNLHLVSSFILFIIMYLVLLKLWSSLIFAEPATVSIDIEYQLLEAAKAGDTEVVKVIICNVYLNLSQLTHAIHDHL